MKKTKTIPIHIQNLQKHLLNSCDDWFEKDISLKDFIFRLFNLLTAAFIALIWPNNNLIIFGFVLLLCWFALASINQKLPKLLILTIIMVSVAWLYHTLQFFMKII